jgi:hypothetical protein
MKSAGQLNGGASPKYTLFAVDANAAVVGSDRFPDASQRAKAGK